MNIRRKIPLILSIMALCPSFITIPIMLQIEPEDTEAILFGLLLGCLIGSILGAIALILNRKQRQSIVIIFSILPMGLLAFYLFMFLTFGLAFLFIN